MDTNAGQRHEGENSLVLNRRQFLRALAAAGAAITLPAGLGEASATEVNAAWERAIADPWHFVVNEYGTIADPNDAEPTIRADVFDVRDRQPTDPERLIAEVERFYPLQSAFEGWCMERLSEQKFIAPDDWRAWVRAAGRDRIDQFWRLIEEWLASPVDWDEYEWFPRGWSGQDRAYAFFQSMDGDVLDALGVVIVEGDCPGSDYFAAELRNELEPANEAALRLGLPFRFRAEGAQS